MANSMKNLFAFDLSRATPPEAWKGDFRQGRFGEGAFSSGRHSVVKVALPGYGWRKLQVEIECSGGNAVECGFPRATLVMDLENGNQRILCNDACLLASRVVPVEPSSERRTLVYTFDNGQLSMALNGVELISAEVSNCRVSAGDLKLGLWLDMKVYSVNVYGDDELEQPLHVYPAKKDDDFLLEVCVDFADDLFSTPYNESMFDQLFSEFRRWGVRRCHWLTKGACGKGWWESGHMGLAENYAKTVENVGPVFDAAVKYAHKYGMEIIGLLKPFEFAHMLFSHGNGTENAIEKGKVKRVGGHLYWTTDFVAEHRELMMSCKPGSFEKPVNDMFNCIELVKENAEKPDFSIEDVKIFVSNDNASYRLYDGPVNRENMVIDHTVSEYFPHGIRQGNHCRKARVFRFSGLKIREPFVVLQVPGNNASFSNLLSDIIHLYGPNGRESVLTYGVQPRAGKLAYDIKTATKNCNADFVQFGIEFDCWYKTPTACQPGFNAFKERFTIDSGEGMLAIAREKDGTCSGSLSPAYPDVHDFWLAGISSLLDSGADGVELRLRNHQAHFAWDGFGFEKPVRDAFLEKYGVDIWTSDTYRMADLRRLRGEQYTEFYRKASQLVRSRGKTMGLHISRTMDIEPEQGGSMGFECDWRTWLKEGLADSITAKEIWPNTAIAEEMLTLARPKGTKIIFSPFANKIWSLPGGEKRCAEWIQQARKYGFDGFQLYESCCVNRSYPDGRVVMEYPELRELFQKEFNKLSGPNSEG